MADEQKAEGEGKTEATTDINVGEHEVLERAEKTNAEMKKNLELKAKLLDREEKLLARQEVLRALGGGSPAGQKAEPPVETSKDYAEKVMTGKIKAN